VRQKFTLFSPQGVPLRATLSVTFREYKTLDEQLHQLNLQSPDHTRSYVVQRGDQLSGIAARHYRRPGEWRRIADENGLEDPRRLPPGTFLTLPPIP
jgi:nucleoid-associated protein YgaU